MLISVSPRLTIWTLDGAAAAATGLLPAGASAGAAAATAVWRGMISCWPGVLRQFEAFDGGRADRTGRFGLRGKGIGERAIGKARLHIGAAAGKADRHQRQHRDLRHPTRAKQLGDTGHGYSLVRNKILF